MSRTAGARNTVTKKQRAENAKNFEDKGKLKPHEFLALVASGDPVKIHVLVITTFSTGPNKGKEKSRKWVEEDYYPTFQERMEAAKAAGPYYAPKLSSQTVKAEEGLIDLFSKASKRVARAKRGTDK